MANAGHSRAMLSSTFIGRPWFSPASFKGQFVLRYYDKQAES